MKSVFEKRRMERFDLKLPTHLFPVDDIGETAAIELQTDDVCAGGAFFKSTQALPVGTAVDVELELPLDELKKLEGRRVRIRVSGAVVRIEDKGMAISFSKKYHILPVNE